ncbi:MAG TPA: ribbon-helix-helix protein, CopG family [Actinomycetota bacterium]|nr:ribbon-helix-helix protein, CopG family [Actinomycetota bacterium]
MKTAISLPDDLFGAAERTAQRLGLTRSELFRRALVAFLQRNDDRLVTDALNKIYVKDSQGSKLDPAIQEIQALSIPADDW